MLGKCVILAVAAHNVVQQHFLGQDHHAEAEAVVAGAVPAVSATMKAVINLAIQYFLLYTAVALVKTHNELRPHAKLDQVHKVLEAGCTTVNYAPMLCVLFLGVRMRAVQLAQGNPDEAGLPQWWVKDAMLTCAWSVLLQTVMVLIVPFTLGGEPKVSKDGTPEISGTGILAKTLTAVRYLAMLGTYGGFTAVCVGAFMMKAPHGDTIPVSPAVACTMNLATQYFFVYLGIAVTRTYMDFTQATPTLRKVEACFEAATNTVNFAPMLCILFIGARMRALQIDPVAGNPAEWVQHCMYACAYAVLVQLVLVFATFGLGGTVVREEGAAEGDISFNLEGSSATIKKVIDAVRLAVMVALYGGFSAVIYSVHADGGPALAPSMQCVVNLTVQYFFVYLLFWLCLTTKQWVEAASGPMKATMQVLDVAKKTVTFCPMLCVLFLGLRLRAGEVVTGGMPQGYAQQGMYLATHAILLQLCLILLLGVVTGTPKVDSDGNPTSSGTGAVHYFLTTFRYLALLCVYGGAIVCVHALFTITPETANGSGSLIHPTLDVPAPVAAPIA